MNTAQMLKYQARYSNIMCQIIHLNDGCFSRLDLDYPLESVLVTAFTTEGFKVDVIGNMKTIITW